ncbi:MAG TPA: hypothetical protein PKC91_05635 [Ignavibacteria bacterium]|nr:hypothetical protein [Ignavibacteria bacterium]
MINIKPIYKPAILILTVFLFLVFNGMEFIHHHSDHISTDNCKVCAISSTLSNSIIESKSIYIKNDSFELLLIDSHLKLHLFHSLSSNSGRAPPLYA